MFKRQSPPNTSTTGISSKLFHAAAAAASAAISSLNSDPNDEQPPSYEDVTSWVSKPAASTNANKDNNEKGNGLLSTVKDELTSVFHKYVNHNSDSLSPNPRPKPTPRLVHSPLYHEAKKDLHPREQRSPCGVRVSPQRSPAHEPNRRSRLASIENKHDFAKFVLAHGQLDPEVELLLERNWTHWESTDQLKFDLQIIMDYLSQRTSSAMNIICSAVTSMWLLFNIQRLKHIEATSHCESIVSILNQIVVDYRPPDVNDYDFQRMSNQLFCFFEDVSDLEASGLRQPIPAEFEVITCDNRITLARNYMLTAAQLFEGLSDTLKRLDPQAKVNCKKESRIFEKADAPESMGGYAGDVTKVLDYLRGLVHIHVDLGTSTEKISMRYQLIISNLEKLGRIVRVKKSPLDLKKNALPRILINLEMRDVNGDHFIAEVQVHFQRYGFNDDFQDFMHIIYELDRMHSSLLNPQDHAIQLSRHLLQRSGLVFDEEVERHYLVPNTSVIVLQLRSDMDHNDDGKVDSDSLTIEFIRDQGTKHEKSKLVCFQSQLVLENDIPVYPRKFQLVELKITPQPRLSGSARPSIPRSECSSSLRLSTSEDL